MDTVDLVVLTRDETDLDSRVAKAIASQDGVDVRVHRMVGRPAPYHRFKWETVVDARNRGKTAGDSPWLMFLDDDVVIPADCVRRLLHELKNRGSFGALAADYRDEAVASGVAEHVAMGATLFRRQVVEETEFRASPKRCDCSCCCEDLRKRHIGINYVDGLVAEHVELDHRDWEAQHVTVTPRILVAFDRRDFARFNNQFLPSLRAAGNHETVLAVGYGLAPRERRITKSRKNVELLEFPRPEDSPNRARLKGFQIAIADLAPNTPVAYWDAGDVVFQSNLAKLWATVKLRPKRLHVVPEPIGHPELSVFANWIGTICEVNQRNRVDQLLMHQPMFNSGFAASSAQTMLSFFRESEYLLQNDLPGTGAWADQLAMNVYCHSDPNRYHVLNEEWNYCLAHRELEQANFLPTGRFKDGSKQIRVVHGTGGSLAKVQGYQEAALQLRNRVRTPTPIS